MGDTDTGLSPTPDDALRRAFDRTPARLLVGRAGPAYRTATWLELRADHAAARDAVQAELEPRSAFGEERINRFQLFNTKTRAGSKDEYLRRPDLGRKLCDESAELVRTNCPAGRDLQVVIGDGLSATAVASQAPPVLDGLWSAAQARGWSFGRPFLVRYCRVGVMNDVGELLRPEVVVLLIGERPGLATAESLSAYMAFRPRAGHTDADRNLVSNVHARGVSHEQAVSRVMALADQFRARGRSGTGVTEGPASLTG